MPSSSSSSSSSSPESAGHEQNPNPPQSPVYSAVISLLDDLIGDFLSLRDLAFAEENVAHYPPSLDTESTLSGIESTLGGATTFQEDGFDDLTWTFDYEAGLIQAQALTDEALEAHNAYITQDLDHHRDLSMWTDGGILTGQQGFENRSASGSILISNGQSKSSATERTNSSHAGLLVESPFRDTDSALISTRSAPLVEDPFPDTDSELSEAEAEVDCVSDVMSHYVPEELRDSLHHIESDNSSFGEEGSNHGGLDQPEVVPQEGHWTQKHGVDMLQEELCHFEHGHPEVQEEDEFGKPQHRPWITSIWYWLAAVLDPPPEGTYRATYRCGCGKLCYIDMEELVPGGAAEVEQEIRKEASLMQCHNPMANTLPRDNIRIPPPTYLFTSTIRDNLEMGVPVQDLLTFGENSDNPNISNATAPEASSYVAAMAQKYLLLCVNTKRGLVKLVQIDVSILTNDQFLFQEIRNGYRNARQGHDWNLTKLIPGRDNIFKPILVFLSMVSARNTRIIQWITGSFRDCRVFVPRKIEFVKFELMPVRLEICVGNIEKPEIPGPEEVQVKKTYEYEPISIKAKILNVPIHELLKPGQHLNRYWWKRFPKKLNNPLTFDEELDCCGWGILITEGWNRPFVLFLCLLAMIVFVVFVTLYSVLTNDGSTGAGIGSFMMAILTLYCTLKYEQWKEQ